MQHRPSEGSGEMAFEKILSETTPEGVLILTMNDPETLNALGEPLMPELLSEVERFAACFDGERRTI
jgi:enoyl-CoA hydratase/carnithine racemase|tara:strand:- start:668 stop:868 length:201 start_codon:yes stop_codon:yes gene_type:complete